MAYCKPLVALLLVAQLAHAGELPDGGFELTLPDGGEPAPAVPAWRAQLELEPDAGFSLVLTDVVVLPLERAIALGGERKFYRAKNAELQRTPPVFVSSEFWWWMLGFSGTAALAAGAFTWWLYSQLPSR
jgi:hypothetical protein